jgi:hypothetical protein
MTDVPSTSENFSKRVPWNQGKMLARSRHSDLSTSGPSGQSSRSKAGLAI